MADIDRIDAYLQEYLRANGLYELSAVDAAEVLDAAGLLPDSASRPGLPLRKLLRERRICGAVQLANGRWFIHRADPATGRASVGRPPGAEVTPSSASPPRAPCAGTPVLPDVLEPGLAVVFVGESAGETSAREGSYYAGPGNCFWSELVAVGITDRELAPREFLRLPEYGVGLTDILKNLSDAGLKRMSRREWSRAIEAAAEDLRQRIASARPAAVCFVGLDPGREIGPHLFGWDGTCPRYAGIQADSHLGEAQVWLCPSTSAAARASRGDVRRVLSELHEQVVRPWQNRKR
jgi:TDG/mug DNA glycosylase family protein